MAKQLNVSLAFTANTGEAKAQLQDLQKQLNNILKMPSNKLGITENIREAISATAELSSRLQKATNVNTGNLDFSKFNNSLKQSGQSLSSYGQQLQKLGPAGQQAFLTLTKSIATAEIPIKRTNALVKEFTTTLANTARWQISSSVLHGLMGSMQSAYRYAQDLNESLNDIRIVTSQSVDQMARFAVEANAAAKALSATTVEYTNASLIYYQQGLNDQQVKERTDITIKMANVSKQSAETVSEQMTAVWNNFYNGSKSLEYYADVMTALGAATASSADEIAGGLEKFAAIGETIGLSYEYAAAALATITSNTRQSEEVVGTALKTIFARIQGLNLGETLDDGTTLNKYSSALEKVGISIFDSAGELKRMDDILNEMGAKWETLNKAQQTALAQTVAGTRQYTQLIALMDNWDKGDSDSMKANLSTAYGSSGALQEQAEIYAESWEAARDRVTAAAEKIYSALLDDDFFIDMLNGFEKVLSFVSQLIDNLGGLKGVFLALGAIITKVFSAQLSQGLSSMAYNIKMAFPSGREQVEKERRAFIDNAVNSIPQSKEYTTDVEKAQQDSLRTELTLQMEYMNNAEKMSAIEADTNKKLIERTRILNEHTVELNKRKSSIDDNISNKTMSLRGAIQLENEANPEGNQINYEKQVKPLTNQIKTISSIQAVLQDTTNVISAVGQAGEQGSKTMQLFKADLMSINTDNMSTEIKTLINEINQMGDSPDPVLLKEKIEALNFELEKLSQKNVKKIKTFVPKETRDDVDDLTQSFKDQAVVQRELNQTNRDSAESYKATIDGIHGAKGAQKQWSDVMIESANVAFNVATALSMVSSAIDTLKDPDVSGMQKLVTVLSTMGMVLPTIISLIGTMKKLFSSETVVKIANAAATWAQVAAEKKYNETRNEGSGITKKNIKETWQDTVWKNTKKKNQDKYIEQVLKDKGYIRDQKTGGWGKTTVGKNGAKRFDPSTVISDDDAIKMAAPDAQKMAGKGVFKALGSKVASAGIAAAGIAIIIGTIAMVVNQLNKAEKAVEKAKAAAQSLSENYDNVKASYDNFINAQSGYETATASMEELTKGTVAYQEALMQANEAAGELLATNKNLKYTIEDGKIVIDEKSLEQARLDELKKVETAQAAKIAGQQELDKAEIALNKRDMARDLKSDSDWGQKGQNAVAGGALAGLGTGLAAGALVGGGVFSVPAALVGGLIGLVGGAITGLVAETSTDTENEAIDLLAQQAEKDETFLARLKAGEVSSDELKTIGIEDEALITALQKNGEEVATLVGEMQANTAAINAQNDLVASNVLSDNEAVQNSEYKDQIIDIAGDAYGHAYDKAMKSEWVDTWGKENIAKINGANDEAKKVFEEYLKYAGLEGQGYELTDTTGNDKNREFVYEDKEGKEHKVSLEAMQAARAAYEASSTLDDSATKLAETFDKLADSSNEADQALLSFVSGKNFEGSSKGEFEDIQNEVGDIGYNAETGKYDSSKVKTYLESSLGEALTDDVAIRYGYENANAMMDAFAKQLNNADIAWDSIKIPDNFKFAEDMSLGTAKALESQMKKIELGPLGEASGQDYIDGLNKMLEGLDPEKQQEALEQLSQIDWSDWDAMEQADAIMKALGKEIDTTSEEWVIFAQKMRDASLAIPDFSKLKEDLIGITSILSGLDVGSSIGEEDYARLVAYNDEWERYFMLQSDGSRKFIGSSAQMRQETRESIQSQREELAIRKEIQQGMQDNAWKVNGEEIDWYKSGEQFNYTGTAQNLIDADSDSAMGRLLAEMKYTDDAIQEIIDDYNDAVTSGDEAAIAAAEERFKTMYDGIGSFMAENLEMAEIDLDEMMASTASSITELNQLLDNESITSESYEKQIQSLMQTATTIGELQSIITEGQTDIDYNQYADALVRLGSEYDSVTQEVEAYQAALARDNEEQIDYAAATLEASIRAAELGEQYDISAEEIENYAEELKMSGKYMEANEKALVEMAKDQKRFDKAVISASKNMSKWEKDLDVAQETGHLVSETATEMAEAYGDLLDIDPSSFSQKFLQDPKNLENMKLALEGNEEAYKSLQAAAKEDIAFQVGLDTAEFDSQFNDLMDKYWQGKSLDDIAVGASLDNEGFLQGLTDMVNAAGMTAQQATDYLSSMGVDAEVINEPKTVQETVGYNTIPSFDYKNVSYWPASQDGGAKQATAIYPTVRYNTYPVTVPKTTTGTALKVTSASKSSGGGVKHSGSTPARGGSNSGGGGGGGGGSKPAEKIDVSKPSDFGERYHTINKQIDNMGREMERASKAADKLWSRKRLEYLEEQNKMLDEEIALLQEKTRQAEEYLKQDTANLNSTATDLGFTISYGSDGEILNYDAIRDAYAQQVIEAQQHINSLSTKEEQDTYQESVIDPLQKKIDAFEEAMGLYYESLETIEENADLIQEKLDQKLQNNFDIWSSELELDIEINEKDLELIEYYLSKIEDDVYNMAEAAALMVGSLDGMKSGNFGGQLGEYLSNLDIYKIKLDELNQKFAAGEITEAAYEEGLEQIRSGTLDNLQSIQELDDAMLDYYGDTLSAVMDEMDKYTDKLEHQTAILEHYVNMMEILGKSYDYESIGIILEGQVKTIENELKVAEAEYDLYQKEAEEKRKLYEAAIAAGNANAAEVYKKEWEAAEEAAMETQSEMLDKTEQWAEAMRAAVENKLKGFAQDLEKSLTGGTTFDQINLQLERAASLQEEYLTTTNKTYETNKLMRKAQQEIDKSSNAIAKQRLKDFIKETNQLQDKSKLSKYELEIQQAKYDLLLAQLALEEAKNAKSTVRLQRDSEGNFGYVYTADQDKIAEAQQTFEDAQNNLYNIGLEGANDYTEKYAETMQEMYDTLTSITDAYHNGEIASREEYEAQMLAAQQYYYEQLKNYQDLYGIALQTDTRVIKDAWSTGMQIMTIETGDWQNAVKTYTDKATATLVDWYAKVDEIANKTGLDNIADKVEKITDESDKLKKAILGSDNDKGVIGALAAELEQVSKLISEYATLRGGLQSVISEYENLIDKVMKLNQEMSKYNSTVNYQNPTIPSSKSESETTSKNVTPTSDSASSSGGSGGSGGGGGTSSTQNYHGSNGVTAEDLNNATAGGQKIYGVFNGKMYYDKKSYDKAVEDYKAAQKTYQDRRGFDTGGYTGSWGPDGKWAMLHEKELVLNKEDTVNFLASMEVLNEILRMIDIQSASAQLGGILSSPTLGGNNSSQTVEQNVHIEASFPGVTDRHELEEAFNNLINTSAQYANYK